MLWVWVALGKACRPRVAQGEQRRKGLRFQARGNLERAHAVREIFWRAKESCPYGETLSNN